MGALALVMTVVATAAIVAPSPADSCAEIDLVLGASRPAVRGVVERRLVASNPLPWGQSVAVVTRVWGAVTVERWGTADDVGECHMPAEQPAYEAVGIAEVLTPSAGALSELERAALNAQFGPPVSYDPPVFARAMAWLRVFPSVPIAAILVGWLVATLLRRRHQRDPYLF